MWYRKKNKPRYYKKKNRNTSDAEGVAGIAFLGVVLFTWLKSFYEKHPVVFILWIVGLLIIAFYVFKYFQKKKDEKYTQIKSLEQMKGLWWREFEKFIEFVFRKKWFKAKTRLWTNDWWIDVDAELNWQRYIIQCKKWNNYKIWVVQLREFYGVVKMSWENVKWIYVTTSELTKPALEEYQKMKTDVELWDRSNLEKYISEFTWSNYMPDEVNDSGANISIEKVENKLVCSKCNSRMLLRKSKRWSHKWEEFYWCSTFPKCRNTIFLGEWQQNRFTK